MRSLRLLSDYRHVMGNLYWFGPIAAGVAPAGLIFSCVLEWVLLGRVCLIALVLIGLVLFAGTGGFWFLSGVALCQAYIRSGEPIRGYLKLIGIAFLSCFILWLGIRTFTGILIPLVWSL